MALETLLEAAFVEDLQTWLVEYYFAMESDVLIDVKSEDLTWQIAGTWSSLPAYDCPTHGPGRLVGSIGIHEGWKPGTYMLVHRDLVDGELRSPLLKSLAQHYPPFCRG